MNTAMIQELFDMLTGTRIPDNITAIDTPNLSPKIAFGIIWFLQEHMRIIPDRFEMCDVCHRIFEARAEGHIIDEDDTESDWYQDGGISREELRESIGASFCSGDCERSFWDGKERAGTTCQTEKPASNLQHGDIISYLSTTGKGLTNEEAGMELLDD